MFKAVRRHIAHNVNSMVRKVFWVVRERVDMYEHGPCNEHNPLTVFMCVCTVGVREVYCDVKHRFQDFS